MKAMILCAGLGTRLRPLTTRWPKPAIPLLGGPLFRYSLATLQRAGITKVGLNTHHLPEVMEATARAELPDLAVSHETGEIQGTGGGIRGPDDLHELAPLELEGVLVASAFHDGRWNPGGNADIVTAHTPNTPTRRHRNPR